MPLFKCGIAFLRLFCVLGMALSGESEGNSHSFQYTLT